MNIDEVLRNQDDQILLKS